MKDSGEDTGDESVRNTDEKNIFTGMPMLTSQEGLVLFQIDLERVSLKLLHLC